MQSKNKKIEITIANICNILGTVIPEKEIIDRIRNCSEYGISEKYQIN